MKAYLRGMINCSRHSDPFVRLFAITENVKILTHFHSFYSVEIYNKSVFRLDECRLLYIYMTSVVDASLQPTHPVYAVLCFISSVQLFFLFLSNVLVVKRERMDFIIISLLLWSQKQS